MNLMLLPGGQPCKGSGRSGNTKWNENSAPTKSEPPIFVKPSGRVILDFEAGADDADPIIFPIADSEEQAEALRARTAKAFELLRLTPGT